MWREERQARGQGGGGAVAVEAGKRAAGRRAGLAQLTYPLQRAPPVYSTAKQEAKKSPARVRRRCAP